MPFHIIVVAAGSGLRTAGDVPKQYKYVQGKAVLRHTVEKLLSCEGLRSLHVIIHPNHQDLYKDAMQDLQHTVIKAPILGGNTRKESVRKGLNTLSHLSDDECVLIHDAARPCITINAVEDVLQNVYEHKAATLALPVDDTLAYPVNDNEQLAPNRNNLWRMQTPQGFQYGIIRKAHERYKDDPHFTDDVGMVQKMGQTVHFVHGAQDNIKITYDQDFQTANIILAEQLGTTQKTAQKTTWGVDVHAFGEPFQSHDENSAIRLGGIDIPHSKPLMGHSDADVVLHALTDALLAATSSGDIGEHFPDTDPQWKGAESSIFLKEAYKILHEAQGKIIHIDITILAEAPKLSPHKKEMQQKIAGVLHIPEGCVSIKATTTEGLGYIGRQEGIEVQALVTTSFPDTPLSLEN